MTRCIIVNPFERDAARKPLANKLAYSTVDIRSEVSGHDDGAERQESDDLTMQRIDFWPHDNLLKGQLSLCADRIERSHRMISEPYICLSSGFQYCV